MAIPLDSRSKVRDWRGFCDFTFSTQQGGFCALFPLLPVPPRVVLLGAQSGHLGVPLG